MFIEKKDPDTHRKSRRYDMLMVKDGIQIGAMLFFFGVIIQFFLGWMIHGIVKHVVPMGLMGFHVVTIIYKHFVPTGLWGCYVTFLFYKHFVRPGLHVVPSGLVYE